MARKYDSTRRSENAARTRQAIVEAAVKLHGQGILTFSALAEEAGVALATVNKHFPTREHLFDACTSHLLGTLEYLSADSVAAIADHGERLHAVVRNIYTIHEQSFGQTWVGYRIEAESPTMSRVIGEQEVYIESMVVALLHDFPADRRDRIAGFARGLLNPLTYRALRLNGGLDYEAAVEQTTQALEMLLGIAIPA